MLICKDDLGVKCRGLDEVVINIFYGNYPARTEGIYQDRNIPGQNKIGFLLNTRQESTVGLTLALLSLYMTIPNLKCMNVQQHSPAFSIFIKRSFRLWYSSSELHLTVLSTVEKIPPPALWISKYEAPAN
jgi:hypothetical protein